MSCGCKQAGNATRDASVMTWLTTTNYHMNKLPYLALNLSLHFGGDCNSYYSNLICAHECYVLVSVLCIN